MQRGYVVELVLVLVVVLRTIAALIVALILDRGRFWRSLLLCRVFSFPVLDKEAAAAASTGFGCGLVRVYPLLVNLPQSLHFAVLRLVRLRLFRVVFLVWRGCLQILSKRWFGRS